MVFTALWWPNYVIANIIDPKRIFYNLRLQFKVHLNIPARLLYPPPPGLDPEIDQAMLKDVPIAEMHTEGFSIL